MLEVMLAAHVTQIDVLNHPVRHKEMEEAFYRAGPDMAVFGRIARFAVACLLVAPLASLLADNLI